MEYKIAPSILSADFSCLACDIEKVKLNNIKMLHIDVMDGHFVPNITIGPLVISALRNKTDMIFDTHLMISNPKKYIKEFAEAGSDIITIHLEAESDIAETIELIKQFDKKAGLSINPDTPLEPVFDYIKDLDMVLIMSVHPGFAGQSFMQEVLPKIKVLRAFLKENGLEDKVDIQIDGGINGSTIELALDAGANVFVAGNYIFSAKDIGVPIKKLREKIEFYSA